MGRRCFIPSSDLGWLWKLQNERPAPKQYPGYFGKLLNLMREFADRW
jgi:hypothetical protein